MGIGVSVKVKLPYESAKMGKIYRRAILDALAEALDKIRINSDKDYIIPDAFKGFSLREKYRRQKSNPTKLTSRTGALKKMLNSGVGKWTRGTSTYKSIGPAIQSIIKTKNKNYYTEGYEGTIGFSITNPVAISSKRSSAQLAARFFWDLPSGVRGKRRPFLTSASKDLSLVDLEELVKKRLKVIGLL
jgi:hypothetical protein